MNKLAEFLQEDNGNFSANRLALLIWTIGLTSAWFISSYRHGYLADIPDKVIGVTALFVTGKVVQKPFEQRK